MLDKDKHTPGLGPRWKHVSARFPAICKALLAEPDPAAGSAMLRSALRVPSQQGIGKPT